jgi:cell division protein FtsQ
LASASHPPRGADDFARPFGTARAFADRFAWPKVYRRRITRWRSRIMRLPPPPGLGIAASLLLLGATLGYGAVAGDHLPVVIDWVKDVRDAAANATGFRIAAISLTGPKEVSR